MGHAGVGAWVGHVAGVGHAGVEDMCESCGRGKSSRGGGMCESCDRGKSCRGGGHV